MGSCGSDIDNINQKQQQTIKIDCENDKQQNKQEEQKEEQNKQENKAENQNVTQKSQNNDQQNTEIMQEDKQNEESPEKQNDDIQVDKNEKQLETPIAINEEKSTNKQDSKTIANDGVKTLNEYLLEKKIIPSRQLIGVCSNKDETIKYFRDNGFPIPSEQQETNPTIFDQAMLKQIPQLGSHKADEQNEDGWTVAMILAFQGIKIPEEWNYQSNIKNVYGKTLQDYLQ